MPEPSSVQPTDADTSPDKTPKPGLYLNWEDWLPFFEDQDIPLAAKKKQIEALWTIVMCFVDADYDLLGPNNATVPETSGQVFDLTAVLQAAVLNLKGSDTETASPQQAQDAGKANKAAS